MMFFKSKKHSEGFTLLEVLVAVLVFSFGLLGIAGMMTISVRNNHNGYLRSQANFLAENMVDRMRANPVALWNGTYAGDVAVGSTRCDLSNLCNYDSLAQYDMEQWAQSLQTALPNGQGNITCVPNGAADTTTTADPPSIWTPVSVYDGVCTITISWFESNREVETDTQTMTLVVQP